MSVSVALLYKASSTELDKFLSVLLPRASLVFFNSAVLVPVLIGLYTRCFAILMGAVMWIGFYVNHFSLLKLDHFLDKDYVWFKFAQTTSITGGLLMLALQGPGSYSVDAARKKEN
ncbi:unnamed protein product [Dibothriocephalus latus]|uniref:Uncharacterized protein n=1 Tax=Dibothriocephalus latus TaxID=60516 RepID=A0A3P7NPU9_DIBLA|nr:unnamed protein product [Dibothriocephalus latus]